MNRIYFWYFLNEILKTFLIGVFVFISLICMAQFLQITEFILIHQVPAIDILRILTYMSVSFLPTIFPMSLLFSILITYARLATDSEIVAFQSFGYSQMTLIFPSIFFSIIITIISFQTLAVIGPNSRKLFDDKIQTIAGQKIVKSLAEKTFVEDLFNFTIYFNEKLDDTHFKDLFIKDNRDIKHPIVIVSQSGEIYTTKDNLQQRLKIILKNGTALDQSTNKGTNIKFETYAFELASPIRKIVETRDSNTYLLSELKVLIKNGALAANMHLELLTEFHRRFSIAASCLVFGILGATLGMKTNRRSSSSIGFILSVICLATYWTLFAATTSLVSTSTVKTPYLVWLPNFLFLAFALFNLKKLQKIT